ncbi:MAG: PEGA domain-containing protein [Methanobrevibacter sp.]|jgi:hypothetical protein|nr:PEGA domain-containing protein [Methanobrevibacter sp.]
MIIDKNKEYWGALTLKNNNIKQIQILNKIGTDIHEIFKLKKNVTFITNADTIYIDGIGEVSKNIVLWEGEYTVTFTKNDFLTETINIIVKNNITVVKNLNRSHGQLNINSSPSGASVYINNVKMGLSPLILEHFAFDSYIISLTKTSYETETFSLNFNVNGQSIIKTLTQIPDPTPDPDPPVIDVPEPVKPAPSTPSITVSSITQNSAKITFTSSNATSYDVYVNNVFKVNTANTTYQLSSLSSSTTYSIKIVAKGNGTAQNTKSFTTLAPVITKPTAPSIYEATGSFIQPDLNYGMVLIKFKSTHASHNYFKGDVKLVDKYDSNGISVYSTSNLDTATGANREGWVRVKCHIPNYGSWVKFKVQVRSYYSSSIYSPIAEKTYRVKIINTKPDHVGVTVV